MYRRINQHIMIAFKALLITGSALVLICCGDSTPPPDNASKERLMTEQSENLTIVVSENGVPSYIFEAPLVEGYMLAKEPYREFRNGVRITTYNRETATENNSVMTANYAIYYEERKLWETMGDVTIIRSDGKELFSQQLFWNANTKMIYSNVDTEIYDRETGDLYRGEGFESDEELVDWKFRKMSGRMMMEVDSTGQESENEEVQK